MTIRNAHASITNTVTLQRFNGATAREFCKVTLLAGEGLVFDADGGYLYLDNAGRVKSSVTSTTTVPDGDYGDISITAGVWSIDAATVTLAKMANLAANSIIGNNTGSAAVPLALTTAQVKTLLAVSLTSDVTGVLQAAQEPAHTGDVTNTAGSLALTITTSAVTLAKMANLPTNTIIGNNTGGSAVALALTPAQVNAMLPVFTSALNGLAPLSGGGTVNFLRADGTWVAPTAAPGNLTGDVTSVGLATTYANVVPLAKGGAAAALTAIAGGITYSTGSALVIGPAGTSGQFLKSGVAAAPAWNSLTLEDIPSSPVKTAVRLATSVSTGNLNLAVGGLLTVDGAVTVAADRVLVKNQTLPEENGIYLAAAGAWTRALDADTATELSGSIVSVQRGAINAGLLWVTDLPGGATLGTAAMTWYFIARGGFTTQATAGATTTLTSASDPTQEFTGTLNQTVVVPSAVNTLRGIAFLVINSSTGTLTIQNSSLATMADWCVLLM